MMTRLIAHTSIGAGLAMWLDLFARLGLNMDQLAMLIVVMTIVSLIIDASVRRLTHRQPEPDIWSLFEEV